LIWAVFDPAGLAAKPTLDVLPSLRQTVTPGTFTLPAHMAVFSGYVPNVMDLPHVAPARGPVAPPRSFTGSLAVGSSVALSASATVRDEGDSVEVSAPLLLVPMQTPTNCITMFETISQIVRADILQFAGGCAAGCAMLCQPDLFRAERSSATAPRGQSASGRGRRLRGLVNLGPRSPRRRRYSAIGVDSARCAVVRPSPDHRARTLNRTAVLKLSGKTPLHASSLTCPN